MTITFVSQSTSGETTGANVTVTAPASIADGDILIMFMYKENTAAITWPTSFTQIAAQTAGDSSFQLSAAWKRASAESGNYTASWTGSTYRDAAIVVYRGAFATGDPQDATATVAANGSQVNLLSCPTITTVNANSMIVLLGGAFAVVQGGSAPGGYTRRINFDAIISADLALAVPGATGVLSFVTDDTAQTVGITIALRDDTAAPASGGTMTPMRGIWGP